jgi:hypothetical protein
MYGLKEAGNFPQLRFVSLLAQSGFLETQTLCLFRHLTRPIAFVLVVDDFGVKSQNRDNFDFLVSALSPLYQVKAHPISSKFMGFHLEHDRPHRNLSLSYRGYIASLGIKPASTPAIYTPPHFGSSAPEPASHHRLVPLSLPDPEEGPPSSHRLHPVLREVC